MEPVYVHHTDRTPQSAHAACRLSRGGNRQSSFLASPNAAPNNGSAKTAAQRKGSLARGDNGPKHQQEAEVGGIGRHWEAGPKAPQPSRPAPHTQLPAAPRPGASPRLGTFSAADSGVSGDVVSAPSSNTWIWKRVDEIECQSRRVLSAAAGCRFCRGFVSECIEVSEHRQPAGVWGPQWKLQAVLPRLKHRHV